MSRVLSAELAGSATTWAAPEVGGSLPAAGSDRRMGVSAANLQSLQERAYKEAFDQGLEEGLAEGRNRIIQKLSTLDGMLEQLATPFRDLDQCVARELVELAFTVSRRLVRDGLSHNPSAILPVVRAAMEELPVAVNEVRIRLNPQDAALVRDELPRADAGRSWIIVEDQGIQAGGCLVESRSARVDARVDSRIAALLAEALGDDAHFPVNTSDPENP